MDVLPFRPVLLPAPPGPPLAQIAAVLQAGRHPLLLEGGSPQQPRHELDAWSLLLFDPLVFLEEPVAVGSDAHVFQRLEALLDRVWPGRHAEVGRLAGPPFLGGLAGALGYDLGRELEELPRAAASDGALPDLAVGLYPLVLAEERATGRRWVAGRAEPERARAFLGEVLRLAGHARPLPPPARGRVEPTSSFGRAAYEEAVEALRELIRDGEVYQVNLAQRFELAWEGCPAALQSALAARFPAPFGALLRTPRWSLISASPELFLRRRGERVESRPIKGTRPRGADAVEDGQLLDELLRSPKEAAELAMIVDLVRNDLGRSAEVGSVAVEGGFRTDAWSTVFHRSALVSSRLAAGQGTAELLAGAFPPASVTGCPKIAAQGFIERLEPVRRHFYTGALGWIGADGDLDLSVAIRIATLVGGRLLVPVGGGITLASDPAAEYDETLHKARALFDVLGVRGTLT